MYFTVNTSFVNYIDQFNFTETLKFPILTNKATSKHTLPIVLMTQDLMKLYCHPLRHSRNIFQSVNIRQNFFDLKERHDTMNIESPNKKFLY